MGFPAKRQIDTRGKSCSLFVHFFLCLFTGYIFVWTPSGGTRPTPHLIQSIGTQCDLVEAITMTVMSFCARGVGKKGKMHVAWKWEFAMRSTESQQSKSIKLQAEILERKEPVVSLAQGNSTDALFWKNQFQINWKKRLVLNLLCDLYDLKISLL